MLSIGACEKHRMRVDPHTQKLQKTQVRPVSNLLQTSIVSPARRKLTPATTGVSLRQNHVIRSLLGLRSHNRKIHLELLSFSRFREGAGDERWKEKKSLLSAAVDAIGLLAFRKDQAKLLTNPNLFQSSLSQNKMKKTTSRERSELRFSERAVRPRRNYIRNHFALLRNLA